MEERQSNELEFADIFAVIKRYKRLIWAAPAIAGIAAFIVASFMKPVWEASTVLQVGRVAHAIEPTPNVVSRMTHPSFIPGALSQAGIKPDELPLVESVYKGSLKVMQVKDTELINVYLRACSSETARNLVQGSVTQLQAIHKEMMSADVARLKAQAQDTGNEIQRIKAEIELLEKRLQRLPGDNNRNSYDAILAATILQNKTNELRGLMDSKWLLDEQLGPTQTFTTRMIGDVYVSKEPVSPNKPLIIGLAVLIGLLGGIFIAFAHNSVSR